VVIFDVNVNHMHRAIQRRATVEEVVNDGIPTSLFTGENYVHNTAFHALAALVTGVLQPWDPNGPVLPALGAPFNASISSQHV
jgi:hypothetical protein